MDDLKELNDMDLKGRFIAQAFVEELEEIEKVANLGFFANLARSATRSGAKMLSGVSKKVPGGQGALRGAAGPVAPKGVGKATSRQYTGNSMKDLAKFYGGKGLMWAGKNPRKATAIAGTGAVGTTAALT
tara:strand:- start:9122 stop:9511 length:390 start_codon:yes stop_codon:yes gene_type:complete